MPVILASFVFHIVCLLSYIFRHTNSVARVCLTATRRLRADTGTELVLKDSSGKEGTFTPS